MPAYEITAAGFDGGTDATDDRVLWVTAPNPETVQHAIEGLGATWCGMLPADTPVDDIDHDLREPGAKDRLRAVLRTFNGG